MKNGKMSSKMPMGKPQMAKVMSKSMPMMAGMPKMNGSKGKK